MRYQSIHDLPEAAKRNNPHLFQVAPSSAAEAPAKPPTRIRQSSRPLLNKLEQSFFAYLQCLELGVVYSQAFRFKLGNGIWYKPDFVVFKPVMTAYEVKGPHAFRGGFENLKVAAGLYPDIRWLLAWRENGAWQFQRVLS